jgi:hypothetical protein
MVGCRKATPTRQPKPTTQQVAASQRSDSTGASGIDPPSLASQIRERTTRRFASADFYKPNEASAPERMVAMAPLVLWEVADDDWDRRFGIPIDGNAGTDDRSSIEPTVVYYFEDQLSLSEMVRDRIAFLWALRSRDDQALKYQGFRMTLDGDGYPVIWELLGDSSPRIVNVSRSLEDSVMEEFGSAAIGQTFAVERPSDEPSDIVVARVLSDGPQPMGPWVYVDGGDSTVTTLLCRCMPSQVDGFRESASYDLRPFPRGDESSSIVSEFETRLQRIDEASLDEILRLPSRFLEDR